MLFRRNRSNKYQLQASTVSPDDHRNSNPWFDFVNLRDSVADYADSLFSLEGGPVAAAATRPYMPNLEVEEQLLTTESATIAAAASSSSVTELDKGELLMELQTLSDSFDELQSTFEVTISNLHDENSFLEEGIKMLTATIDEQAAQIEQLQKQHTLGEVVGGETDEDGIGAIFENKVVADDTKLAEVQNKAETLEKDNEMLRQRVRALEVELSDIAFESRKIVSSAAAVEDAAAAVMETVAPTISEVNAAAVVEDITTAASDEVTDGIIIEETNAASEVAKLSPHAPSTPIPQHILQQKEIDFLRMQVREYEAERKSVRKLFGRGIRRGAKKVGKVLDLWRPIYLILWGEIRGDGKMAL
jgi:predicted  nucleic acid-binding Zn-ribbon protein